MIKIHGYWQVTNYRILHASIMLQVLHPTAGIPVVCVALGNELHYRTRPDNACWSFRFVLLGVWQEERPSYVSYNKLICKICQVGVQLLLLGLSLCNLPKAIFYRIIRNEKRRHVGNSGVAGHRMENVLHLGLAYTHLLFLDIHNVTYNIVPNVTKTYSKFRALP